MAALWAKLVRAGRGLRAKWAEVSFEKKLGMFVAPVFVAVTSALLLTLITQFLAALEAFKAAALRLAAHVAAHSPEGVSILKAAFRELDGAQGRVAHENELLEVFQRKGAGLPQGPRP